MQIRPPSVTPVVVSGDNTGLKCQQSSGDGDITQDCEISSALAIKIPRSCMSYSMKWKFWVQDCWTFTVLVMEIIQDWGNTRQRYLHCFSNGDDTVLRRTMQWKQISSGGFTFWWIQGFIMLHWFIHLAGVRLLRDTCKQPIDIIMMS